MNIKTAAEFLSSAKSADAAGDLLGAARLYLAAQRAAQQCRAGRRIDIREYSHACIAGRIVPAILADRESNHSARSEAGQIRAESLYRYMQDA